MMGRFEFSNFKKSKALTTRTHFCKECEEYFKDAAKHSNYCELCKYKRLMKRKSEGKNH